jgi:hypothetical protein
MPETLFFVRGGLWVLTQSCWVTAGKALTIYEVRVQWDRRVATRSRRPLAVCYLTGLVEPCGALPRKFSFIYLFV